MNDKTLIILSFIYKSLRYKKKWKIFHSFSFYHWLPYELISNFDIWRSSAKESQSCDHVKLVSSRMSDIRAKKTIDGGYCSVTNIQRIKSKNTWKRNEEEKNEREEETNRYFNSIHGSELNMYLPLYNS